MQNKWYSMLKNKFPPQLELISDYEINMGIRELSEGKSGKINSETSKQNGGLRSNATETRCCLFS